LRGPEIALALLAAIGQLSAPDRSAALALTIDPCLDIDEQTVRHLVDLELGDPGDRAASRPGITVSVLCVKNGQEIRLEPRAVGQPPTIRRPLRLESPEGAGLAAREARTRELALAIAELVRRFESDGASAPSVAESEVAQPPQTPPVPEVRATAPTASITRPASPVAAATSMRIGALSAVEFFSGGRTFVGGDLIAGMRVGRRFDAEIAAGVRVDMGQKAQMARLDAAALDVAVALAARLWSYRESLQTSVWLRARGFAYQWRVESDGGNSGAQTTTLAFATVAAGPRVGITLGRRALVIAEAGVGRPLPAVVVRDQGRTIGSVSGWLVSGNLGAAFLF
jgi:hypothetical protein